MVVVGVDVVLNIVGGSAVVLVLIAGFTVPEMVRFGLINPLGAAGPKSNFLIYVCLSSFLLNNTGELPLDVFRIVDPL